MIPKTFYAFTFIILFCIIINEFSYKKLIIKLNKKIYEYYYKRILVKVIYLNAFYISLAQVC